MVASLGPGRVTMMQTEAWAKLDGDIALPLADHGADVGAVMAALLDLAAFAGAMERAAGRPLGPHERERLVALAFLHDMGKANRAFWRRQRADSPWAGHTGEVLAVQEDFASQVFEGRMAAALAPVIGWGDDLFLATLAHHGAPVLSDAARDALARGDWRRGEDYDPVGELAALIEVARARFPLAFADAPSEALPPRAVSLFAGLLTLADWLGSDTDHFPIDGVTGEARAERSGRRAREVVRELGLARGVAIRAAAEEAAFAAILGPGVAGAKSREAQTRSGDPDLGPLTVLEAETGSGKTEAALWRFVRLFAAGEVDALYFALPTRTSAVQMHRRVWRAMRGVFGDDAPEPVLAVPGYIRAGDEEGRRIGLFETEWHATRESRGEDARWAAESPKRFLAARVAVGTVDQALMGALKLRHAHLRAAALSRALLVVDEVHASDRYMTEVLGALLRNHLAVGGHAMLLSATLGARARAKLMACGDGGVGEVPSLDAAIAVPYPALHGTTGVCDLNADGRKTDSHIKDVRIETLPAMADLEAAARAALDAARRGARVLVIRNTVNDAVATQLALEALEGSAPYLFRVAGVPTLHHGRFAPDDRPLLDAAIEDAFGKTRSDSGGMVAVGTQTLEISLDLDADLMLTDLAPMDVLLQRLGRLHRHADRQRPAGFEAPRAVVLVPPARDLAPYLDPKRRAERHGLGPATDGLRGIYPDLLGLEATWRLLERGVLHIPRENRELVELATHPEALEAVARELDTDGGDRWATFFRNLGAGKAFDGQIAEANALDMADPFTGDAERYPPLPPLAFPGRTEEGKVLTRLGEDGTFVPLASPVPGPFGASVSTLKLPGWMTRGDLAEALERGVAPTPDEAADGPAFTFVLGEGRYRYDRLGLHATE